MNLTTELELEDDGRWIAEIDEINGVVVYGDTKEAAVRKAQTLASEVINDRKSHGE